METYKNTNGEDCVSGVNADGTSWSMLKSAYDEQQAHLTESLPPKA
jgi:hypothetical protein